MDDTKKYPPSQELIRQSYIKENDYKTMYQLSIDNPDKFWGEQAKKFVTWFAPWKQVKKGNLKHPSEVRWFEAGKLNVSYNCLDRHLPKRAKQTAIIWEGDDPKDNLHITYAELHEQVCRFANVLKKHGVRKGDRVCIYLPMIPEALVAMLSCARIGAIHTVVFGGFSPDSLKTRIQDADCKLIITADEGVRGGKPVPLKHNTDTAVKECPNVQRVIVVKRTGGKIAWHPHDIWYHEEMTAVTNECEPEQMLAEDPLFMLYTSGSTGKPKGILHATGGYLVYVAMSHKYLFNYHEGDIYWCTADIGWITGHSYAVYAPLCNGATTVIFEGVPNYPTFARFWEITDKHKVNIIYTAPTAIRAIRREGDELVKQTSRKSLKLLATAGEPISPDVWEWFYNVVGDQRCPIIDTWWQTEAGGILITSFPGATKLKPGAAAWPYFGIQPQIVDDHGKEVGPNVTGKLVIADSWPGMMQTVYGNPERFEAYFNEVPGKYLTGDGAYRDADGYYTITGRDDDVIKVSGHRLSTQELESAFLKHVTVAEAAVVAKPHDVKGHCIYAFVVLKSKIEPSDELKKQLTQTIRTLIGPIAAPDYMQWATALPKTRSGKIMRRVLRKIANNEEDLGDLSTLVDPSVIDDLVQGRVD